MRRTTPPRRFTIFPVRSLSTLGILLFPSVLLAQGPLPTAYNITSALPGPHPGTMTAYRSGSRSVLRSRERLDDPNGRTSTGLIHRRLCVEPACAL